MNESSHFEIIKSSLLLFLINFSLFMIVIQDFYYQAFYCRRLLGISQLQYISLDFSLLIIHFLMRRASWNDDIELRLFVFCNNYETYQQISESLCLVFPPSTKTEYQVLVAVSQRYSEAYSKPCQTFKLKYFANIAVKSLFLQNASF